MKIDQWFEERETAAKRGRPVWNQMLRDLRKGKYCGVVIHKIDRSARNLKDWADLGDLIDQGIEVKFANEGLDLSSRGGRLSADIQAVVAADYIRNLREETKKGLYGRLKQGFYPWRAPIGYLDHGAAKQKTIDPIKGPLVRAAFELYATGQWTILSLVDEMNRRGLTNLARQKVTRNGIHNLLRNPFYYGLMSVRRSGETYPGIHEGLISKATFERVQDTLHGRVGTRNTIHDFLFRKTIQCVRCGYRLIGEIQKGTVYYRCHGKRCNGVTIREEQFSNAFAEQMKKLEFSPEEVEYFKNRLTTLKASWSKDREAAIQTIRLRAEVIADRLNRLTDAYLDQALDEAMFEKRRTSLYGEQKTLESTLREFEANQRSIPDEIQRNVELAKNANSLYKRADVERKRRLLRILMSNCLIRDKTLEFVWRMPFQLIAAREKSDECAHSKEKGRAGEALINRLMEIFKADEKLRGLNPDSLTLEPAA